MESPGSCHRSSRVGGKMISASSLAKGDWMGMVGCMRVLRRTSGVPDGSREWGHSLDSSEL